MHLEPDILEEVSWLGCLRGLLVSMTDMTGLRVTWKTRMRLDEPSPAILV